MFIRLLTFLTVCLGTQSVWAADPKIEITSAFYGRLDDGPKTDVQALITGRIREGKVRIEVANDLFGDPAPQQGKSLKVEYKLDGVEHTVTVEEGDMLLIPEPVLMGDLKIIKAEYGDLETGSVFDVSDDVRSRLKDGILEVEVNNDLFGDPASGVFKQLKVTYKIGDVELVKRAYEGATMKIRSPQAAKPAEAKPTK